MVSIWIFGAHERAEQTTFVSCVYAVACACVCVRVCGCACVPSLVCLRTKFVAIFPTRRLPPPSLLHAPLSRSLFLFCLLPLHFSFGEFNLIYLFIHCKSCICVCVWCVVCMRGCAQAHRRAHCVTARLCTRELYVAGWNAVPAPSSCLLAHTDRTS